MSTISPHEPPAKADGRREAGERTRARILEVTSALLAERGEDAVRLRDITDAAHVNVAAVNYHFGSLKSLCAAATRDAVQTIISETTDQLARLRDDATLEEIVMAWVRPLLGARRGPSCAQRQAALRITARAGDNRSDELCDWLRETRSRHQRQLAARLQPVLPELAADELQFRVRCVAGIFDTLSTADMQTEGAHLDCDELERLLIPVLTGALSSPPAQHKLREG